MLTEEDRRRLYESRHNLGAAAKPEIITASPAQQSAIAESAADVAIARDVLAAAAATVDREKGETDAERTKLQQASAAAIRRYGFIRGRVDAALLNVDPDAPLPAGELDRRRRVIERQFKLAPSDFERIALGATLETLGSVAGALESDPDLKPLGLAPSLAAAHAVAVAAAKELNREVDEDAMAMAALRDARDDFDRAGRAHALLIESVLVRAGREGELGRYVLARDPAYAARRAAGKPVAEEPGADDAEKPAPAPAVQPG